MPLAYDVPGRGRLEIAHLVLDANGTLTDRGAPVEGVSSRLEALSSALDVRILSADTYGTLVSVADAVGVRAERVSSGADKERVVAELGPDRCAAIGNGANDEAMLARAVLGIAVVGPEGAAGPAVRAADVVCTSILDALDLLLDGRTLVATLRT